MGALELKKPNGVESMTVSSATPMDLLEMAVSKDLSIEKLQQLMELQLKWEANEARKAFVSAMNAFKANPPTIVKNRDVAFGNTKYSHATLDNVCEQVTKALSVHGITHRWKIDDSGDMIAVTCVLTHGRGHSEETTMRGPADQSGSKNPIQARASTITYLERYTLLAATGLAAGNDTDGATEESSPSLSDERFLALQDGIENSSTLDELKSLYSAACKEADAAGDQEAKRQFNQFKNKRYKELYNAGR